MNDDSSPLIPTRSSWRAGLLRSICGDFLSVFLVCCCPCLAIAQVSSRLNGDFYATLVVAGLFFECFIVSIVFVLSSTAPFLFVILGTCALMMLMLMLGDLRNATRKNKAIQGNMCYDMIVVMCCPCCSITQMTAELRTSSSKKILPAYQSDDEV